MNLVINMVIRMADDEMQQCMRCAFDILRNSTELQERPLPSLNICLLAVVVQMKHRCTFTEVAFSGPIHRQKADGDHFI